ncbi:RICIN domain-containing protein, partial [uncultured Algibacter sp.]|uniref:RICIN domain-containing protein n=1 Tax=uncultured Algibacter sp. TaxID=298659 RepID=UPI00321706B8
TDGTYIISARHSGKNIEVSSSSTANGANVQQWSSNGRDNQKWIIKNIGDGFVTIKAKHSNKFMDISNASTANGANLHTWGNVANTQTHRQFKLIPKGNGYYNIQSRKSGKCLDVQSRSTANGGNIHQWDCTNNFQHQEFKFESTNGSKISKNTLDRLGIKLYPNPVKDVLNLSYSEQAIKAKSIVIYNAIGT